MYNKLFSKIITSSIWLEPDPHRIVWVTFLASMDEDGFAQFASVANLAHTARVDLEAAKEAVEAFENPDANSGDPDHEGRRIERVPGGWMVLNAVKYRNLVSREVAKEQTRERVARHRAKKACNGHVTVRNDLVTPSEAEAEANTEAETHKRGNGATAPDVPRETFDPESIHGLNLAAWTDWRAYRKGVGKPLKPVSLTRAAKALAAYGGDQQAVVDQSIAAGWQGLFGLKTVNGAHRPGRRAKTTAELEAEEASRANQ